MEQKSPGSTVKADIERNDTAILHKVCSRSSILQKNLLLLFLCAFASLKLEILALIHSFLWCLVNVIHHESWSIYW